jgi:VanZ family protein
VLIFAKGEAYAGAFKGHKETAVIRLKPYIRLSLASVLRAAPWVCILAVAVLSLVPGKARPHTGLPGQVEHFLAYFMTALLQGFRLRNLTYHGTLAIALCAYAGILETLQIWIPGRSAQFIDFAASSCGVLSGMILSVAFSLFRNWELDSGARNLRE